MLSQYRVYRYDQMDTPAVTAGTNAVLIGAHSGLFPDMGHAVPGEMGGLWVGEKKLCDGFFFAIDDVPLTAADACEQSPAQTAFHYRMQESGLHVVRRQMIPDGVSGCVIELTVENQRSAPRLVEVSFTVRTEILTVASARGTDGLELGRDVGEYDEASQAFYARDSRNPWHVVWGADKSCRVLQADLPQSVYGFGNTKGKGVNGRLFYRLSVAAGGQSVLRLFVLGGYASRMKAEEALEALRADAGERMAQKIERLDAQMASSDATLPDPALSRGWNWSRIYGDWLTRSLPRGGMGLCSDLPEHPSLFGEGFAEAMGALLPLGGGARVQEMLRTLSRLSEEAQLAPGRLARRVSRSGHILEVGGVRESAQFVALVHRTLLWTGDAAFARDMLPMTGLCVSYLRRSTRGLGDVPQDLLADARAALAGQAYILRMTGADDTDCRSALAALPEPEQAQPQAEALAAWHGQQGHVEQMIGCLQAMVRAGERTLPGAMPCQETGVLLSARSAAAFIWPMTESLFGLSPDAASRTLAFAPHTPIGWDGWQLEQLAVGGARIDVRSERVSPSQCRYTLRVSEPGWRIMTAVGELETDEGGVLSVVMGD
ncbi:MAG: hypothetical protein ACI4PG_00960 [Candidatus Ventricola sp.]